MVRVLNLVLVKTDGFPPAVSRAWPLCGMGHMGSLSAVAGVDDCSGCPVHSIREDLSRYGKDDCIRRRSSSGTRGWSQPARGRGQGDPWTPRSQCRVRKVVGSTDHHERWRIHCQGERNRGRPREGRHHTRQGAAKKTDDVAGDGTTTATVLAQALVREGLRNVAAGADPLGLKRGIEKAVEAVTDVLLKNAIEIETKEQIAATAGISAGDAAIGELIAESIDKVGKEGVVTVEESNTFGLELELT